MLSRARILLKNLLENSNIDNGHGIDHADAVLAHTINALKEEDLDNDTKLCIQLAALLHDADDRKFFPRNYNNENSKTILKQIGLDQANIKLVLKMINLVSCSKNGNNSVEPEWLLIPRAADRLEAMGQIGIKRAHDYNIHTDRPLFLDSTPRATNVKELMEIANPERFQKYKGTSNSMIDHFYDKLLHINVLNIKNKYLNEIAEKRHLELIEYCLNFGKNEHILF